VSLEKRRAGRPQKYYPGHFTFYAKAKVSPVGKVIWLVEKSTLQLRNSS
jgi:hypothetical protein|tara:strand:+ start:391 stop:537 length:147 start_codon:yes stop_codon:yes gene_type:complete